MNSRIPRLYATSIILRAGTIPQTEPKEREII